MAKRKAFNHKSDLSTTSLERRKFLRMISLVGMGGFLVPFRSAAAPAVKVMPKIKILKQGDKSYAQSIQLFNSRLKLKPAAVVRCKTEQDVVRAIHYANVAKLQVTVKSGGHSFEGFSSNNGGLMVDLTELNGIDYSKQDHSVKIGPGARLGNVSSALFPKGRLLPSGSCAGVGVGGLTLGGGYGLFAREFGLTCDHLTGLRMVDGQGRVIDSDDDPELLHACRGGGNGNFGVVTQMRFRTVPVPKLFSSQRIKFRKLDPKTVGELAKLWFAATAKIPNDVFSAFVLNGTSLTILITFFRKQSTADVEAAFASLRKRAWKNEAIQSAPTQRAILRYYGRPGPLPFKNASAGYYNSHEQIEKILPAIAAQVAKVSGTVWQVNTLGGAINSPEYAKASLYPHRASPWLGEIQGYWDNPKREERCVANVAAVQKLFADHGIKDHYRNYPDIGFAHWQTAYYGDVGVAALRKMKQRYDRNNTIYHPQSVR